MSSETHRGAEAVASRVESGARQWVLYYDGECPLCEAAKRWLSRLDVFHRVEWKAYQSLERPPRGLSWSDLESAAWLDTGSGRPVRGFNAFRTLALRLPLLLPVAPALWMPGMGRLGEWAYGLVARNRCRLSLCGIRKGGRSA